MARILILGHAPLPLENTPKGYAGGKRTWQFARPLLALGHEVCVIGAQIPGAYPPDVPVVTRQRKDNLLYISVVQDQFVRLDFLRKLAAEFTPQCVIGVNTFPASISAALDLPLPLWADLNGSVMAEAQMKASVYHDDVHLKQFLSMELKILNRADRFSAVSNRQRYAVIGELGLIGRLNQWTAGDDLVVTIPNAEDPAPFEPTRHAIRGTLVPDDSFIVLYAGSYNTWTDVETLFAGLELAMARNPRIVFVSTGGAVLWHDEATYPHFEKLVAASAYRDRFHLQGWVAWHDVANFYLDADVAINADKISYEALLGARTRALDWLRAGLPFLTTPSSEITEHAVSAGAAFGYRPNAPDDLASVLLQLADNPDLLRAASEQARRLLIEHYTAEITTQPLQTWVRQPRFAADYAQPHPILIVPGSRSSKPGTVKAGLTESVIPSAQARTDWFDLLQPVWQHFIHALWDSPLGFLVSPLRMISAQIKARRRPLYGVAYRAVQLAGELRAGEDTTCEVTLINTGRMTWRPPEHTDRPVYIAARWLDAGNQAISAWQRVPITDTVLPGKSCVMSVPITASDSAGTYTLELDVIHAPDVHFSELGDIPFRRVVQVQNA